jgi:hypothetical protein
MAYFAELNTSSVVIQTVAVNNDVIDNLPFPESEPVGIAFCQSLYGPDTVWKQTSYNRNFRKNYAMPGYTYDPVLDAFIPPQPDPSCTLNVQTCRWVCPD